MSVRRLILEIGLVRPEIPPVAPVDTNLENGDGKLIDLRKAADASAPSRGRANALGHGRHHRRARPA